MAEVSEFRNFIHRITSFLDRKDVMVFANMNRVFRYHFFTMWSKYTETINLFSKDDFEHRKESQLRWITNVFMGIDLTELDINWRRLYTLANLKWFSDFMWMIIKRSKNLEMLRLDFRMLPQKWYEPWLYWTECLLDQINTESLFEIVLKSEKQLPDEIIERVLKFENITSLGISTSLEKWEKLFQKTYEDLYKIEIACSLEQIEPLNIYKFLERHQKIRKVVFSSCGSYNIRKLMLPLKKIKKYVFEGINEQRGKYGITELLRERSNFVKSLVFKNCSWSEREFTKFDVAVLPKLKKLIIESSRGMSTINRLMKAENCPQLREVYFNNFKLLEPDFIITMFMNGFEIRILTLIFLQDDWIHIFNKGLEAVITKIMRNYARFMPLPLCMFNNLQKLTISDLNEESIDMFKKIHMIDYNFYNKFSIYEGRTNKKLM